MNAAGRLIAYGAAVAVTFGGAFVAAGAVVPDRVVERWSAQAADTSHDDPDHGGGADTQPEPAPQKGVSMSSQGYVPVSYTHLTLPTIALLCRSRWSPYH